MKPLTDAERWRVLELTERSQDGVLEEGEAAELNALLRDNPEARTLLAQSLHLQAELRFDERLTRELAHEAAVDLPHASETTTRATRKLRAGLITAIAASVLLLGALSYQMVQNGGSTAHPSPLPTIATVIKASHCKWAGSTLPTAEGSRVSAGTLELVEGLATLRFDSGAEVVLEAPATLELSSAMACRLKRGTLVANVPPSAIGFTVDTKDAKVVDFGTKFGVSTGEDGKYMVQVMEGRVEVDHQGEDNKSLVAGQTVDRGLLKRKVNPQMPEVEPNRWQPNTILSSADGWQVISTAYGRGKDSYIQSSTEPKNYGDDPFFRVKRTTLQPELNRKGYVGFDVGKFTGKPVADAELVLSIEPSDLGFATLVPDSTFAVYGLRDQTQDAWEEEGITWNGAPAHDPAQAERHLPTPEGAVLLGRFEIGQGVNRGTRTLHNQALVDFLKQDTDGIVTFIICRETDESGRSGLVHAFATKESGNNTPPLLRVKLQ